MPVKVKNNFAKAKTEIEDRAQQFVLAAAAVGAKWSKYWAPIEYSTLVNSQRIDTFTFGPHYVASVSFNTRYAVYLNGTETYTPLWKPKPPEDKDGPAWNPLAVPRFLNFGFEDQQPQQEINQLKSIFKV